MNDDNHNHHGNPVGAAPPKKKRKQTHESYEEFLKIIENLSNDYASELFVCLLWTR